MPRFLWIAQVPGTNLADRITALWPVVRDGGWSALTALLVLLVGWLLARLVAALVRRVLRVVRFDDAARSLLGARAIARHEPAALAAWAVYWLLLAAALLLALELVGIPLGASVAARLSDVLPRIVTSAVLFVAGSLIALLCGAVLHRFLSSADIRAARLFSQTVTSVLVGFSGLLALEQLGFAAQFVMVVGIVATASAGLGLALAFGLGCRELVRDFIVEYLRSLDDERPARPE